MLQRNKKHEISKFVLQENNVKKNNIEKYALQVINITNLSDNEKPDLVFQTSVYLPEKYHSCKQNDNSFNFKFRESVHFFSGFPRK